MTLTQFAEISSIISCVISVISLFISIKALNEIIKIKITISKENNQTNNTKFNFGSNVSQSNNNSGKWF